MITSAIDSFGVIPGTNITPSMFTPDQITEAEALAEAFLLDNFPTQDFGRGTTYHATIVRPLAMFYLAGRFEWESLRATQSLGALSTRPDLMIDEVVDAILSNFRISRRSGAASTGRVRVNLTKSVSQPVADTTTFTTTDGVEFVPTGSFRLIDEPQDEDDIQIFASGTAFYALIPVRASAVGVAGQIKAGTPLTMSPALSNFVSAAAFDDFHDGVDKEMNDELIARLPAAMTTKNLASPLSIKAVIMENFPDVSDVTVQGAFDPVMTRGSHGLLGIKSGGFADIYFKLAGGVSRAIHELTATLESIGGQDVNYKATYSVALGRDTSPGHYFVVAVRDENNAIGSYFIKQELKDIDVSPVGSAELVQSNSISEVGEGTYSRYQTNVVFFEVEYDESLGSVPADQFASEMTVFVEVVKMLSVEEIQNFVSARDSGVVLADYLVRAAVPALVSLPIINVDVKSGTTESSIAAAITSFIHSLKIGETLRSDALVSAIKSVSGVISVRLPIRLAANVFSPEGTVLELASFGDLAVPSQPLLGVVPQNSAFFIEPSEINLKLIEQ